MNAKNIILKNVIQSVENFTGISINYEKINRDDFVIELETSTGRKIGEYFAEIKPRISYALIGEMAIRIRNSDKPLILVTEYVSQPQAEKLYELDIPFIDTAGNAYIKRDDLFIFVSGKKTEIKNNKDSNIFRPAGIKLLLAFLTRKDLEKADYRTIAEDTGISKTAVGRLMNDLEKAGYLIKRGSNERFLVKKEELVKRWILYYGESFRSKLKPVKYHSTKYDGRWWEKIDIAEYNAVWGGETGGAVLTKHLRPQTATIYADSMLPKLQAKYGLVRDEKGEIEILRKFWKFGEVGDVAPPLVVYADLLATADQRNIETAQIIYDKYLTQITEENS